MEKVFFKRYPGNLQAVIPEIQKTPSTKPTKQPQPQINSV